MLFVCHEYGCCVVTDVFFNHQEMVFRRVLVKLTRQFVQKRDYTVLVAVQIIQNKMKLESICCYKYYFRDEDWM